MVQSAVLPFNDFLILICPPSLEVKAGFIEISPAIVPVAFPTVRVLFGAELPMPTFPPIGLIARLYKVA